MEWKTVQGTQYYKPAEIEVCEYAVYIRKDIQRKTVEDENGSYEVWEYQEVMIPNTDGKNIVKFSNEIYEAKIKSNSQAIDDILIYLLEG